MKKITKKEINERIKTILSREAHKGEKVIYKEIISDFLYENSYRMIATFKTVDNFGFITIYNVIGYRNENNDLNVTSYSTSTDFESRCIVY